MGVGVRGFLANLKSMELVGGFGSSRRHRSKLSAPRSELLVEQPCNGLTKLWWKRKLRHERSITEAVNSATALSGQTDVRGEASRTDQSASSRSGAIQRGHRFIHALRIGISRSQFGKLPPLTLIDGRHVSRDERGCDYRPQKRHGKATASAKGRRCIDCFEIAHECENWAATHKRTDAEGLPVLRRRDI